MRFVFPRSHAYPGGKVTVDERSDTGPSCLVEFGDGTSLIAEWHRQGEAIHLQVPAYRTAKGNPVAARSWRLVEREDGQWRSERLA